MEEVGQALSHHPVVTRRRIYTLVLACFLTPLLLLMFYCFSSTATSGRMGIVLVALLAGSMGGICGWMVLKNWELQMQRAVARLVEKRCGQLNQVPSEQVALFHQEMNKMRLGYEHQIDLLHSSVAKSKEQVLELNLEMDKKLEQMRVAYLEFEDLRKEYNALGEEYKRYQLDFQGQLNHKDSLIEDYLRTIGEQREVIEKKQGYIGKLEGKVRDLMYEIRSLLQLEDPMRDSTEKKEEYRPDPSKGKPYDFSLQLSRYLEMAESFTGADHLGGRFLNSGANRYEIDLRPLIDKLSHEAHRIVFIYAPGEQRFLFISETIRDKLGWSPEKIIKDFRALVIRGGQEWFETIQSMEVNRPKVMPLALRHKGGEEVAVDCYMGLIMKGPFAHTIIGMFV